MAERKAKKSTAKASRKTRVSCSERPISSASVGVVRSLQRAVGRGRPKGSTKVEIGERELGMIEAMAGCGLTKAQISHILGVHRNTFHEYEQADSEIAERIERGRAAVEYAVSEALVMKALSGDVQAIRWYEMTRTGRSEKQEVKTRHYVLGVPAEPMSEEEWMEKFGGLADAWRDGDDADAGEEAP